MQHTDYDDSRFVVNAVDMIRTDRMFLTNPSTGRELAKWMRSPLRGWVNSSSFAWRH